MVAARKAQAEPDASGELSPARRPNPKRGEGVCHALADGRECPRGAQCPYRHGDTPEEHARVQAIAAKGKGKGKGKPSGAVPA